MRVDAPLDPLGRHRASCTRSGRIKKRATPTERTVARIFREAGACVRSNVFLRDMNINVAAQDSRRIEVLAQDLPCFSGAQLGGHYFTQRIDQQWRSTPSSGRRGQSSLDPGKTRQGVNIPRDCNVRPLQTGRACHRDRREMERGSCPNCPDARVRQSSGGPLICAVSRRLDVGAPVDAHVGHHMCRVLRRVAVCTGLQSFLVSDGWRSPAAF